MLPADSPMIFNFTGFSPLPFQYLFARTAELSICERLNGGKSISARISLAKTRPIDSSKLIVSAASEKVSFLIIRAASAIEIITRVFINGRKKTSLRE